MPSMRPSRSLSLLLAALGVLMTLTAAPGVADAAIQLVGTTTASGTNAAYNMSLTSLSGGIGTAPAANDLVVVLQMYTGTAHGNPGVGTSGYTELFDVYANSTYDANFSMNYKVMGASPDTVVSCNPSSNAASSSVCMAYVFRGESIISPIDIATTSAHQATGTTNSSPNCPAITPVTPDAFVFCAGGATGSAVAASITWPTTPTGIGYGTSIQADPGGASAIVAVFGRWATGAYDPAAWTMTMGTAAQDSWAAASIAIRPGPVRRIRLFNGYKIELIGNRLTLQPAS